MENARRFGPSDALEPFLFLNRASDSVRAVVGAEENRFTRALDDLNRLSAAEGIPIAIVGGLAAIRYGYPSVTEDIDIVVKQSQLNDLIQACPNYGFKVAWEAASGWHTLMHGDVEINIVPEGGKARDSAPTAIPGPELLGVQEGVEFASLPGWIELKLSSGRVKDEAQVVEVLKQTDESALAASREHIARIDAAYLSLFDQLAARAKAEKEQESDRR